MHEYLLSINKSNNLLSTGILYPSSSNQTYLKIESHSQFKHDCNLYSGKTVKEKGIDQLISYV